jgi:glutaredoxin-like protein NrdH
MKLEHVPGRNKGEIVLFALSTCGWCGKTKALLNKLGVEYSFVFVDLLSLDEREEALTQMLRYNPGGSFPTLVINDRRVIVGYREEEITEELG